MNNPVPYQESFEFNALRKNSHYDIAMFLSYDVSGPT